MAFITQNAPLNQNCTNTPLAQLAEAMTAMIRGGFKRQAMKSGLGRLSERQLRDIGLTRHDVSVLASALPSNGGLELTAIAKSRAGNW